VEIVDQAGISGEERLQEGMRVISSDFLANQPQAI